MIQGNFNNNKNIENYKKKYGMFKIIAQEYSAITCHIVTPWKLLETAYTPNGTYSNLVIKKIDERKMH